VRHYGDGRHGAATRRRRLAELVQWLPLVALDKAIGNVGADALREITTIVTALVS
jgi:hypothetical protein